LAVGLEVIWGAVKQSVTVKIGGHKLSLRTEDDPQYVQALADQLTLLMEEIRHGSETASAHQVALLAGLRIMDELYQLKRSLGAFEGVVRGRVERVLGLLDEREPT
jgi:cell division protein ZapA (FtsZ GTPase activity inhibitor)